MKSWIDPPPVAPVKSSIMWLSVCVAIGILLYVIVPFGLIPPLERWARHHEGLMIGIMFAPLPISLLVLALMGAMAHIGFSGLIIRRSSPLQTTLQRCGEAIRSDRRLLAIPLTGILMTAVLL